MSGNQIFQIIAFKAESHFKGKLLIIGVYQNETGNWNNKIGIACSFKAKNSNVQVVQESLVNI